MNNLFWPNRLRHRYPQRYQNWSSEIQTGDKLKEKTSSWGFCVPCALRTASVFHGIDSASLLKSKEQMKWGKKSFFLSFDEIVKITLFYDIQKIMMKSWIMKDVQLGWDCLALMAKAHDSHHFHTPEIFYDPAAVQSHQYRNVSPYKVPVKVLWSDGPVWVFQTLADLLDFLSQPHLRSTENGLKKV